MLSRFICALSVTLALLAALPAPAQAQQAGSIAVLNIQTIMRDSLAAKAIKDQLEKKQKAFQTELASKEQQLQKEDQELAKQRSVLSQDAFDQKVRDFKKKASDTQRDVQTRKSQLDKAFGQALNDVQKAVSTILEEMAKEKGYTLVVPTQQILYSAPSLDVTQEVLSRLNKSLPSVTVKF